LTANGELPTPVPHLRETRPSYLASSYSHLRPALVIKASFSRTSSRVATTTRSATIVNPAYRTRSQSWPAVQHCPSVATDARCCRCTAPAFRRTPARFLHQDDPQLSRALFLLLCLLLPLSLHVTVWFRMPRGIWIPQ
jgi:hypothetical protein